MFDLLEVTHILTGTCFFLKKKFITHSHESTNFLCNPGQATFKAHCIFVTFPCGILGQVWYLITSFPDLCRLSYFQSIPDLLNCTLLKATQDDLDAIYDLKLS